MKRLHISIAKLETDSEVINEWKLKKDPAMPCDTLFQVKNMGWEEN